MNPPDFDPAAELAFAAMLLAGNDANVERLAERLSCVPRMLAVRNARAGRPLPADELRDIAQDTFVVILRQLPDYKPIAPLESWIYGICCLQFRAALRRRFREAQRSTSIAEEGAVPDSAPRTRLEDAEEVHLLLTDLPGLEADVLRLKHLEGLTFEDVGARLELSSNTVKTVYYRALSALRQRRSHHERTAEGKRA